MVGSFGLSKETDRMVFPFDEMIDGSGFERIKQLTRISEHSVVAAVFAESGADGYSLVSLSSQEFRDWYETFGIAWYFNALTYDLSNDHDKLVLQEYIKNRSSFVLRSLYSGTSEHWFIRLYFPK